MRMKLDVAPPETEKGNVAPPPMACLVTRNVAGRSLVNVHTMSAPGLRLTAAMVMVGLASVPKVAAPLPLTAPLRSTQVAPVNRQPVGVVSEIVTGFARLVTAAAVEVTVDPPERVVTATGVVAVFVVVPLV